MAEATCELIKSWKDRVIITKFIRTDNAGENKLFEQREKSKGWQLRLQVEYPPRDTPQHNHLEELAFATIGNKIRALLVCTDIPWNYNFHLYREEFNTVTDLDDW